MLVAMSAQVKAAVPVLPAADVAVSLAWWTGVCGFTEAFCHGSPPAYAGIERDGVSLHLAGMTDTELARRVGGQTMVRIAVSDVEAMYAEYQERGGVVHPNGPLRTMPWGSQEFGAIDPNGVCVSFVG
jgi:uncharacterized glyoxalase superfamily protein PhnB